VGDRGFVRLGVGNAAGHGCDGENGDKHPGECEEAGGNGL
jgi:hypothetical protein